MNVSEIIVNEIVSHCTYQILLYQLLKRTGLHCIWYWGWCSIEAGHWLLVSRQSWGWGVVGGAMEPCLASHIGQYRVWCHQLQLTNHRSMYTLSMSRLRRVYSENSIIWKKHHSIKTTFHISSILNWTDTSGKCNHEFASPSQSYYSRCLLCKGFVK